MEFSERLQFLMDQKKITQMAVAKGIGVSRSRVSEWLNGKVKTPQRATLLKLSDLFECNIDWIADEIGQAFRTLKIETTEHIGEFERRKTDKILNEKLAKMEKAVFKTQCPGYFYEFFDFIADKYGADKKGAEAFFAETLKSNPKYRDWLEEKKKAGEKCLPDAPNYGQAGSKR